MSFLGHFITKNRDPDVTVPITSNLNSEYYFDPDTDADLNLFKHVNRFVAQEFTKVIISFTDDVPSRDSLSWLFNVNPNNNQTGNQLLYVFAKSLLDHGVVYYKLSKPAGSTLQSFEISAVEKPGFSPFKAPQIRQHLPRTLIQQYSDLLTRLSTKQTTNALEINTKLRADTTPDQVNAKIEGRLKQLRSQISRFGAFTTIGDETSKDHAGLAKPDAEALEDLRNLIYETLSISPRLLSGTYTEEDYRAFYSTHLMPLKGALEELITQTVIGRDGYIKGERVSVILDLLQFSTLESFTNLAKQGLYNGYLTADEIRAVLGKDKYPNGLGQLVMTNKNAVVLNGSSDIVNKIQQQSGKSTNVNNNEEKDDDNNED